MSKNNKRIELKKYVLESKKLYESEYPELKPDTDAAYGKAFEVFLCRDVYGPRLGINSQDDLDSCMDLNSSGEGPIDIAILPEDDDLHIYESKWKTKDSASFDKSWTDKVLRIETIISKQSEIEKLPRYAKEKINDFLDNPSKDKTLHMYLSTNTAPNPDQTKDFEERTEVSTQRFKKFNLIYHLHRATVVHDEWSRVHSTQLSDQEIKKDDIHTNKRRIFELADKHKDIHMVVAAGTEVVDWVKQNTNLFHENIRGYRGKNNVNKEMLETIDKYPEEFITFNNGMTATATEIEDLGQKVKLKKFQIINGCQTAETLRDYSDHKYKNTTPEQKQENLKKLRVLMRVVKVDSTASDTGTKAKLIKANNTQTPINSSDFRSTDPVQVSIETFIKNDRNIKYDSKRIHYARKVQQLTKKKHDRYIKLTELTEHVFAFENDSYTVYRNKKSLYDDTVNSNSVGNYWKVFGVNNRDALRLSDSRITELFGICFLCIFIEDILKGRIKKCEKDSEEYTYLYLKRIYVSLIGHGLRHFLSSSDYDTLLRQLYKGKIFQNSNFQNTIYKLIDCVYDGIEWDLSSYKQALQLSGGDPNVNIRNYSRTKERFISIKDRFLKNNQVQQEIKAL